MENYTCRKCGTDFSEDDCYDEILCPQCGCPANERLDPSNVSLEFDLPQEFEVYDDNGEVNERYKISEVVKALMISTASSWVPLRIWTSTAFPRGSTWSPGMKKVTISTIPTRWIVSSPWARR